MRNLPEILTAGELYMAGSVRLTDVPGYLKDGPLLVFETPKQATDFCVNFRERTGTETPEEVFREVATKDLPVIPRDSYCLAVSFQQTLIGESMEYLPR